MFYIVLISVFAINVFSLIFLTRKYLARGFITDYIEPQNLFILAMLSAPATALYGFCGGGPWGALLGKRWQVRKEIVLENDGTVEEGPKQKTTSWNPHHYSIACVDTLGADEDASEDVLNKRVGSLRRRKYGRNDPTILSRDRIVSNYNRLAGMRD